MGGVYMWTVPVIIVDDWGRGFEARYAKDDGTTGEEVPGAGWADSAADALDWANDYLGRLSNSVALVVGTIRQGYAS